MIEIDVPLPGTIAGIVLWPFIFYRPGYRTKAMQIHEHYHWHQALRWCILPWYISYVLIWLFMRNRNPWEHPMEKEAYKLQWAWEKEHGLEKMANL